MLGDQSLLPQGVRVPPREWWDGSPAARGVREADPVVGEMLTCPMAPTTWRKPQRDRFLLSIAALELLPMVALGPAVVVVWAALMSFDHMAALWATMATGPLFVRDAQPGDVIKVELLDVQCDTVGTTTTLPKIGPLWDKCETRTKRIPIENGKAVKKVERFRAYDNYGEAFADYARLLSNNNRYAGALNTGSNALAFARGLARGGYATDPAYAEKLASVAQRTSA